MILSLCIGFLVAALGAFAVARFRGGVGAQARASSAGIVAVARRSAAIRSALLMGGSIAVVLAFTYALFPDIIRAFYQSDVFWPVTLGLTAVAALRTLGKGGRLLGSLILVLLTIGSIRTLWTFSPSEGGKQSPSFQERWKQKLAEEADYEIVSELTVALPQDGSWSRWIDLHDERAKWTGDPHVYVNATSGKTYLSNDTVPYTRYFRFRATKDAAIRTILLTGRISYAHLGEVPPAQVVELFPEELQSPAPVSRRDSVDIIFSGSRITDTIRTNGSLVDLELLEGDGSLIVTDDSGKSRLYAMVDIPALEQRERPTNWIELTAYTTSSRVVIRARFRTP